MKMKTIKLAPTGLIRKVLHVFMEAGRKYGGEWWLLVAGALIVLFVSYLALFPGNRTV